MNAHLPVNCTHSQAQPTGVLRVHSTPILSSTPSIHPSPSLETSSSARNVLSAVPSSPTVAPASTPQVPTLHDFSLSKVVGSGTFGTVYLARHRPSGARVALKVIPKYPVDDRRSDKGWGSEILEKKLKRAQGDATWGITQSTLEEYFALHRLKDEERVLQILAAFHDLRYYYLATVSLLLYLSSTSLVTITFHRRITQAGICLSSWVFSGDSPLNEPSSIPQIW